MPANPWSSTTIERDRRHLPAPARVRRRARALWRGGRVHVAGVALDAARAVAGARRAPAVLVARRRALRRLLRPRGRQGHRPARGARLHERDGGRELPARCRRGPRGTRAADRRDGRPPARAARRRRRPGDRPGQALRRRGQVVLRGRLARGDARAAALDPPARLPCGLDRCGRSPRSGAPELPAARAARARRGAARRRQRAQRRPPLDRADRACPPTPMSRPRRSSRSCAAPPAACSSQGATSAGARTSGPRSRPSPPQRAGRCSPTRCRARAAASMPSPTTTRCCASTRSPRPRRRTSSCASATCRRASRCERGCATRTPCRCWSTPMAPGRTPTRSPTSRSGQTRRRCLRR